MGKMSKVKCEMSNGEPNHKPESSAFHVRYIPDIKKQKKNY